MAILGFTFKENCPDVRNTRVIDIVNELVEYGINPIISDPEADEYEVKNHYGIEIEPVEDIQNVDAIVIAVSHNQFTNFSRNDFDKMFRQESNDKKILIDIKGILNRNDYQAFGYRYWSL